MPTYAQILDYAEGGRFTPFAHLNHRIIRCLCHRMEDGALDERHLRDAVEDAKLYFSLRSAIRAFEVFGSSYADFVAEGIAGAALDERLASDLYGVYRRRLEADVAEYLNAREPF